jgi:hypothetical protein
MTQRNRDRKLATLWNQGYLCSVIAEKLGYANKSNVSHAARRLGLTARKRGGWSTGRNAIRKAQQVRGEARMLANLAKAEIKDHGPQPKMWRCMCGGPCLTGPEGHVGCLKRLWIAGVPISTLVRGAVHAGHTQEEVA